MGDCYDCIVVGAGVEGSATAFKIAQNGQKTLLLEQYELLHTNGSSHGSSRITRNSYAEKCYAALTADTFKEWKTIEELSGQTIYVKSGLITVGKKGCPTVEAVIENLEHFGAPHQRLNHEELTKNFPEVVYSSDYFGVYDDMGGVLLADKALSALQELVRRFGGEIRDKCKVDEILPGSIVTLSTNQGTFKTKSLVLCPGTWGDQLTRKLGLNLPLTLVRCFFMYWKEKVPGTYSVQNGMPCVIDTDGFYSLPSLERPGHIKGAIHGGYEYDIENSEIHEDKPPYNLQQAVDYVEEHFPGLESSPSAIDKCKYTMTPDEIFILDKHPNHANIVIAVGFSGTGFKMAPVVGNILRDLVIRAPQKYDIEPFRMNRFAKKQSC